MGLLQNFKSGLKAFADQRDADFMPPPVVPEVVNFAGSGATSTFQFPSDDLIHALIGTPTAAGPPVTRETALRVAAYSSGVFQICNDYAPMPVILRETKKVKGRWRTQEALDDPLYALLKFCPNQYQTAYELRWFMMSQLVMASNFYCQIQRDQAGDIIALMPLNAWHTHPWWDRSTNPPTLKYRYTGYLEGGDRVLNQDEIWHVSVTNLEGFGLEGTSKLMLGKEAISLLMAAEEVAGRNFANGLNMSGFLTYDNPEAAPDEVQVQSTLERLKKDYASSANAGKFTYIPGMKFVPMSWNAKDSQLLDSRKWSEMEIVRMLGGAPLLVKLGLGEQNSTYASSSAFLESYWSSVLLPYATAIEQSITRDLIPKKKWTKLAAKHYPGVLLRGSPKERAETNQVLVNQGSMTLNESRAEEDRDSIEGGDVLVVAANSAIFDPTTGEWFIPGQKPPSAQDPDFADEDKGTDESEDEAAAEGDDNDDEGQPTEAPIPAKPGKKPAAKPAPAKPNKAQARLTAMAESMADRVLRKEAKGKIDAKFVADVLNIDLAAAEKYVEQRKDLTEDQAKSALIALAIGDQHD